MSSPVVSRCIALLELMISDRHQKREIRQLEQELPRWQVLVDNITGTLTLTSHAHAAALLGSYSGDHPFWWKLFLCVGSPGMSMPDFDNQTLAALRGRMVRYLMRSREVIYFFFKYKTCTRWWVTCWWEFISNSYPALQITLGRATKDKPIDVDLSLEGPAWKISRKQGEYSHIL